MPLIEYQDIRPGGAVISSWLCAPDYETGPGYEAGMYPSRPFERQRREQGGEWETVQVYHADGSVETWHPNGHVFIDRVFWE